MSRTITNALFSSGRLFRTETYDFLNHVLLEEKRITALYSDQTFDYFRIPVGSKSDLASTPRAIWAELPPFGLYAPDCFAHDAAYRGDLERKTESGWEKAMLSKRDSDDLLLALMKGGGVPEAQYTVIYQGVHIGGQSAFDADRKALL